MAGIPTASISMADSKDNLIRAHYKTIAETHGPSPRSSMEDDFVRKKELEWIANFYRFVKCEAQHPVKVLDIGCGNGYALQVLSSSEGMDNADQFWGLDFSEELLSIARERQLKNCMFTQGDVRALDAEPKFFDWVYTERCLVNILDADEQREALRQIARVLKPNAYYLMIECFTDGLQNYNKARAECGLTEIPEAHHNKYLDKGVFFNAIRDLFTVVESPQFEKESMVSNFLSSYYFVSRVLYPSLTKAEVVRNSEVAKFFSFLAPMGNYSPIQAYVLRRK